MGRWLTPRALWLAAGGAGVVRWAILSSTIAMPALVFYRHFRALVDSLVIDMELQAVKLVELVHGERK